MEKWEFDRKILKKGDRTFEYKGYKGIVRLQPLGHLCGYVVIPEDSEFYELSFEEMYEKAYDRIDVHGGITFIGDIDGQYCLGFDCGHVNDYIPPTKVVNGVVYDMNFVGKENYRNIAYVGNEIKKMIDQIDDIDNWDKF